MTDREKAMMNKMGLSESDFEPKDKESDMKERIKILEDAFAEFVSEVLADD